MSFKELEWQQVSATHWRGYDPGIRYVAKRDRQGIWLVKVNGATIGEKGGFQSFEDARHYVDYGGIPNRIDHNPETGEIK